MKFNIIALVAIMFAATGTLFAQVSAEADATANILTSLVIEKEPSYLYIDFGDIVSPSSVSTVTIAAELGVERTSTGDVVLLTSNDGHPARFNMTGLENATVLLSIEESFLLSYDGTNTMVAEPFLSNETVTLNLFGHAHFFVGGTLTVGANQFPNPKPITYTGTFHLTAEYQ